MRVVIFGQKWLAVEVLRQLSLLPRVTVGGVCPDTSWDRLEEEARLCGIPVFSLEDVPPCDLGVAAYCQRYLPAVVRARCGLGILAYHPSLLPRHRGRRRHPLDSGHARTRGRGDGILDGRRGGYWPHRSPGLVSCPAWRNGCGAVAKGAGTYGGAPADSVCGPPGQGRTPPRRPQDQRVATFEPAVGKNKLGQ